MSSLWSFIFWKWSVYNGGNQLVLEDEDFYPVKDKQENKNNGCILDPCSLDELPKSWLISEANSQGNNNYTKCKLVFKLTSIYDYKRIPNNRKWQKILNPTSC